MSETGLQKLKADVIVAMKAGDRTRLDVLRQFVNRTTMTAKNDGNRDATDKDVITAGLKIVKEANETRSIYVEKGVDTSPQDTEIAIVSEYLPRQMSEDDLRAVLVTLSASAPEGKAARGYYNKELNARHKGEFDNAVAQRMIAEMVA
jgi:uncharacterized protein YqeY